MYLLDFMQALPPKTIFADLSNINAWYVKKDFVRGITKNC